MWPFKRTPKPSDATVLADLAMRLAGQLERQSQSSQNLNQKFLASIAEKDAQIRLVLESKFQQYVTSYPPRPERPQAPEDIEHLSDVSEMSESSVENQMEKNTTAYNKASDTLAEELQREFLEIAQEHAKAHGHEAQA